MFNESVCDMLIVDGISLLEEFLEEQPKILKSIGIQSSLRQLRVKCYIADIHLPKYHSKFLLLLTINMHALRLCNFLCIDCYNDPYIWIHKYA